MNRIKVVLKPTDEMDDDEEDIWIRKYADC